LKKEGSAEPSIEWQVAVCQPPDIYADRSTSARKKKNKTKSKQK